jgi:hypothetical protein
MHWTDWAREIFGGLCMHGAPFGEKNADEDNQSAFVCRSFDEMCTAFHQGNVEGGMLAGGQLSFLIKHLNEVRDRDPALHARLRRAVMRSVHAREYLAARTELYVAAALIRSGVDPVKRESPDFEIPMRSGTKLFAECTSVHFESHKARDVGYKVEAAVRQKSSRPYASRSTALFVEVTHLVHMAIAFPGNMRESLRDVLKRSSQESSFGSVILFDVISNKDLRRIEGNFWRWDSYDVNAELRTLLNIGFAIGSHVVRNGVVPNLFHAR